MGEIRLKVTQKALDQFQRGQGDQRQIAICGDSPEVMSRIREANSRQRVRVRLGGCVVLEVEDTHAIWRAHQAGEMAAGFDSLFELLSRRPDVEMRFVGEVV